MIETRLPSRRDKNKEKVVEAALAFFVRKGIREAKVADIAKASGLTERSVFRYFETKDDLVLASCLLFWERAVSRIEKEVYSKFETDLPTLTKIERLLASYVKLFFTHSKELLFCQEAESHLARVGKIALLENKPPKPFFESEDPLAKVLREGMRKGEILETKELPLLYMNTYDALLGFMQKLASVPTPDKEVQKERIDLFIETLLMPYRKIIDSGRKGE